MYIEKEKYQSTNTIAESKILIVLYLLHSWKSSYFTKSWESKIRKIAKNYVKADYMKLFITSSSLTHNDEDYKRKPWSWTYNDSNNWSYCDL